MRPKMFAMLLPLVLLIAAPASAQSPGRDATRAELGALLTSAGARTDVNIAFRQSTKQPYNFIGTIDTAFNLTIPQVNPATVYAADPFAPAQ